MAEGGRGARDVFMRTLHYFRAQVKYFFEQSRDFSGGGPGRGTDRGSARRRIAVRVR